MFTIEKSSSVFTYNIENSRLISACSGTMYYTKRSKNMDIQHYWETKVCSIHGIWDKGQDKLINLSLLLFNLFHHSNLSSLSEVVSGLLS